MSLSKEMLLPTEVEHPDLRRSAHAEACGRTRETGARLRMHVIPPDSPNTAPTRPADLSLGASRRTVALHFVVTAWCPMRQLPDMLPPCAWAAGTLWVKT